MKRFFVYILILLPVFSFGQLFPKIADFKGDVRLVVEKMYGKEVQDPDNQDEILRPKAFSGERNIYLFDQQSNLISKTNTLEGEVNIIYLYQKETKNNRIQAKEFVAESKNGDIGDYLEYDNYLNSENRIEKADCWVYNAKDENRVLYLVEQDAEYSNDRLLNFVRYQFNADGDTTNREKINLAYDSAGNMERIERKDLSSGFTSVISCQYDGKGNLYKYSIDFLVEIQEYKKYQPQDVYYKYDRHGNWIRKYLKFDKSYNLQTKRRISYFR